MIIFYFYLIQKIQNSIVNGSLPCSIDESTTLAALQLRIHELESKFNNDLESESATLDETKAAALDMLNNKPLLNSEDYVTSHNSDDAKNEKLSAHKPKTCCFSVFNFCECITSSTENSAKYTNLQKKQFLDHTYKRIKYQMKI